MTHTTFRAQTRSCGRDRGMGGGPRGTATVPDGVEDVRPWEDHIEIGASGQRAEAEVVHRVKKVGRDVHDDQGEEGDEDAHGY